MIDENKIIDASYDFEDGEFIEDKLKRAAFRYGINWFKDNLWHDAKEIPDPDKWILYEYDYEGEKAYNTVRIYPPHATKRWQVFIPHTCRRWLYITDLLKGGNQ